MKNRPLKSNVYMSLDATLIYLIGALPRQLWKHQMTNRVARYLTGENLKLVRAEFSTLSLAALLLSKENAQYTHGHI